MPMDQYDLTLAAKSIAEFLHSALRLGRIERVNIDTVRAAVAGYAAAGASFSNPNQRIDLEDLTLRKFVEACP